MPGQGGSRESLKDSEPEGGTLGMEAGKGFPGVRWWPCEHLARVTKDTVSCDRKQPDDLVLTTQGLQWATVPTGGLAFLL